VPDPLGAYELAMRKRTIIGFHRFPKHSVEKKLKAHSG
jgi:hypothetical protein